MRMTVKCPPNSPKKTMPELSVDSEHIYHLGGKVIPGVTEIIDSSGLIPNFAKKEDYRLRGQYVHFAMALFGRGRLDWQTLDPRILGYVLSGAKFYEEMEFKPTVIETPDYHPDYLYGFTIDALGESRIGLLLPDWKTGKAMLPATRLQLAAYREGTRHKHGQKFRTVVVELDEGGGTPSLKFLGNERADWNDFLSCLNVYRLNEAVHG